MAYQQKENSGALFKNDRKKSAQQPDYTGKLNVHGAEFRLAWWIKNTGTKTFMSLKISPVEQGEQHVTDEAIASGNDWGV
jgi:hypothetical protein